MPIISPLRDSPQFSLSKNPDDVVITLAIRTPLCKATKGGFKDTKFDTMVFKLLQEVKARMNIDASLVEDICLGNVCNYPAELG
jgi:acetyl-CoA acyltransferase 1